MNAPQQRPGRLPGEDVTKLALIGLGGLVAVAFILRLAGSVTAFLTGAAQPTADLTGGVRVFFNPSDPGAQLGTPGLNPVLYWAITVVLLAGITTAGLWVWRRARQWSRQALQDPHRQEGTATRAEVARTASVKALMRRAGTLRPTVENPTPRDVGYRLGTSHGHEVWASVEDSILLIGPPRSGKGLHVVIPAILDAPGAVVTTSTRPDNVTACLRARRRIGPVAVFDPQHLAEGLPAGMRWSPVRGCGHPTGWGRVRPRAVHPQQGHPVSAGHRGRGREQCRFGRSARRRPHRDSPTHGRPLCRRATGPATVVGTR